MNTRSPRRHGVGFCFVYTERMHQTRCYICLVLLALFVSQGALAKEIQAKDAEGRDYWLYVPERIDKNKTYTLVVGVHGYRGQGQGAAGMAGWVDKLDVIVLGPTYDSNGYQYLQKGSDQQTLDLVEKLREDYKLHDKIFIAGFSGGSQYAHRFAMKYPELVAGCAAHSGGTWGTGDYYRAKPNPEAKGVLFAISCGEEDAGKSFPQAPMGRFEWAKKYATMLDEGGFVYDAQWWPGVGHQYSKGARQQTLDCFIASTQLLPQLAEGTEQIKQSLEEDDYSGAWNLIRRRQRLLDRNREGIVGKALQQWLTSSIESVDQWALGQVAIAVRENEDERHRTLALRKLKSRYKDLPETVKAIEAELTTLD